MPFLNWFVETTSAMTAGQDTGRRNVGADDRRRSPELLDDEELLADLRQPLVAALGDDDEILDPDAAAARQVDARLDGDDVAHLEDGAFGASRRRNGASCISRPTP